MSLYPCVIVAHNVLMVQARQQSHLALDPAKVPARRVDRDPLHSIAAAVQLVLYLPSSRGQTWSDSWPRTLDTAVYTAQPHSSSPAEPGV